MLRRRAKPSQAFWAPQKVGLKSPAWNSGSFVRVDPDQVTVGEVSVIIPDAGVEDRTSGAVEDNARMSINANATAFARPFKRPIFYCRYLVGIVICKLFD